ncbi:hypothetical protein CO180_04390 [candidate division WWE3 bacterium CG_4_9_14_3_um_filter_41_6]|uniref:Type II secretion system protein n=1 Tax=candidate division WWE3 bacterium CG_4_10_14_0_2_um_filter_41_14 TaxID=1975072 RepID=A0A2M7TF12_UNCKA|nr:MAG: hypothetical protein COY32_06595 [candidate division WWE3 bacterium CG_4_10_14_0_2_um_filter_41_14]PJA38067.1 MAG: hypothetical protein CO180_04390 [candidate division WWE3 bacterium CG_4_9_14_3_um_filter_41_6]
MRNFFKRYSHTSGFTLIELLITVGVLAIVSGLSVTIFVTISASYDKADIIARLSSDGNRIMDQITRSIRNSQDARVIGGTELVLSYDKSLQNLEYANNGNCTQVRYYLSGTSVFKQTPTTGNCATGTSCSCQDAAPSCASASSCPLNSNNVSIESLTVSSVDGGLNPDLVTVSFTLTQDASLASPDAEQQSRLDFTRTVSTRGY